MANTSSVSSVSIFRAAHEALATGHLGAAVAYLDDLARRPNIPAEFVISDDARIPADIREMITDRVELVNDKFEDQ